LQAVSVFIEKNILFQGQSPSNGNGPFSRTKPMSKNFPFFAVRRFAARLAVGLALVLPALTVPTLGAEAVTPLVGVDWLKAHLNDPSLVVLDIRSASTAAA
jgi:hypothetical protein